MPWPGGPRPVPRRTWVTPRSSKCSHRSDAAPRSTASAAWSWPSVRSPGTQQKSAPSPTRRLSNSTAVTGVDDGSPRTSRHGDVVEEVGDRHHVEHPVRSAAGWQGCSSGPGPT